MGIINNEKVKNHLCAQSIENLSIVSRITIRDGQRVTTCRNVRRSHPFSFSLPPSPLGFAKRDNPFQFNNYSCTITGDIKTLFSMIPPTYSVFKAMKFEKKVSAFVNEHSNSTGQQTATNGAKAKRGNENSHLAS